MTHRGVHAIGSIPISIRRTFDVRAVATGSMKMTQGRFKASSEHMICRALPLPVDPVIGRLGTAV
jgi:hypothetical protein